MSQPSGAVRAARIVACVGAVLVVATDLIGGSRSLVILSTVLHRRAAVTRIGEPRVTVGSNAFEKVLVSDRPAWFLAGAFDDGPGEAVAVVDSRGAEFFDPGELRSRGRAQFGRGLNIWNSF